MGQLPPARPGRTFPPRSGRQEGQRVPHGPHSPGRIFVGCEGDELGLGPAVGLIGSTPFFFSSDFPHEVTEETCREEIDELLEQPDLTVADAAAILHGNAERLYRFPVPATAVSGEEERKGTASR